MAESNEQRDYSAEISALAEGKVDKIVIHPKDFAEFQRAYHSSPAANRIEGEAQHGGEIIYRAKK